MKANYFKYSLLCVALTSLALTGCSDNDDGSNKDVPGIPRVDIQLSRAEKEIVTAQSEFAFDFFKAVNTATPSTSNTIVSPLSMAIDLSLLANGTSGKTYKSIIDVLHLGENTSIDDVNALNSRLVDELLAADNKVNLSIANSIWVRTDFDIKDSFKNNVLENYNAPVTFADLTSSTTYNMIDKWGSDATNGMVPNASKSVQNNKYIQFVLLNALYFEGKWSSKFLSSETTDRNFKNNGTTNVKVPTMKGASACNLKFDNLTVATLPYGNKAYAMYILLPDEDISVNQMIEDLNYEKWNEMTAEINQMLSYPKDFSIYLPKFSYSFEPELNDIFKELGLDIESPDISAMSDDEIANLNILQQSKIEVEENGTKAATVSSVVGGATAAVVESLEVNRPFAFIIQEFSTGSILFAGKVTNL